MCNNCTCNKGSKKVPRQVYKDTLNEFIEKKGLLYPIYADIVIPDFHSISWSCDYSTMIKKYTSVIEGGEDTNSKVIGYFASLPCNNEDKKYIFSMSFCVPQDYENFDRTYAKFSAMRKVMSGTGLLVHCDKDQKIILSTNTVAPVYYFMEGNSVRQQCSNFMYKCSKYYK